MPSASTGHSLCSRRALTPWGFLAPALAVLVLFSIAPTLAVIYYSFTSYTAFAGPDWVGLENYHRLIAGSRFWFCLQNSFLYLLVTPIIMALSLTAAVVVHSTARGGKLLRLLLFLPVVTPAIVASMSFRVLFNETDGVINTALSLLGLPQVRWLTQYPWTLISAMIVTAWKGFGYYMMVFLAGLIAVPRELEEAATIDGAGRYRTFWHVVLPSLRPMLALVATISSIGALKVFDELYITVQGAPITHQTAVPLIYRTLSQDGEYGTAAAQGVLLFVIILAFTLIQLRVQRVRDA
ncbi:MAG TPA: sugar ABC transporter permease [Tepidisphaeraceae bacterium]|nr:sugar ABC transporter permease [Tepidisphaeraceae bacterium]